MTPHQLYNKIYTYYKEKYISWGEPEDTASRKANIVAVEDTWRKYNTYIPMSLKTVNSNGLPIYTTHLAPYNTVTGKDRSPQSLYVLLLHGNFPGLHHIDSIDGEPICPVDFKYILKD